MVTMDRGNELQQNIAELPFGVLLVLAPSNRMVPLQPLAPRALRLFRGSSQVGFTE